MKDFCSWHLISIFLILTDCLIYRSRIANQFDAGESEIMSIILTGVIITAGIYTYFRLFFRIKQRRAFRIPRLF
jgi:hypothetical protein